MSIFLKYYTLSCNLYGYNTNKRNKVCIEYNHKSKELYY